MPRELPQERPTPGDERVEALKWAIAEGCPYDSAECRLQCPEIGGWLDGWEAPAVVKEPEAP